MPTSKCPFPIQYYHFCKATKADAPTAYSFKGVCSNITSNCGKRRQYRDLTRPFKILLTSIRSEKTGLKQQGFSTELGVV